MLAPITRKTPGSDLASPLALATWERALKQDSELNFTLQQLLESQGHDMTQALLYLRNRDLQQAEEVTKRKMLRLGRCPVCTLQLPCQHYQRRESLPKEMSVFTPREPVILNISHSGQTPTFTTRFTPSPIKTDSTPVRYRSPEGVTFVQKPKIRGKSEVKRTEERRLRLLEKLDRYRELRLRKEIEKLEEIKRREDEEKREELNREQRRLMRQVALKHQLADYQEKVRQEQENYRKLLAQQAQKQRLERNKRSFPQDKPPNSALPVIKATTLEALPRPSESGDLETVSETVCESQAS